jgi:hypothetical protein
MSDRKYRNSRKGFSSFFCPLYGGKKIEFGGNKSEVDTEICILL